MHKFLFTLTSFTFAGAALAHDGHGLTGSHWHGTDTLGFLFFGALAGLIVWYLRK